MPFFLTRGFGIIVHVFMVVVEEEKINPMHGFVGRNECNVFHVLKHTMPVFIADKPIDNATK